MSDIANLLKAKADSLNEVVNYNLEKEATVNALVEEGMDSETAIKLVDDYMEKSAETRVKILSNEDIISLQEVFEKVASYVEELEQKLDVKIEKSPEEILKQAETKNKLASIFTEEELSALENVPDTLIEKLASQASEPWELGKAAGIPREKTDPLLEFILS